MPLKFSHRKPEEVPGPGKGGRVNLALVSVLDEMRKLATGMVLEIETGDEKAIRATKSLITRAANQMDTRWQHWHVGTKIYARPMGPPNQRRPKSERANLRDYRP